MTTNTNDQAACEATKLFTELDRPSLHALSYALRHPDTWPKDFNWDFGNCEQCAMGLAYKLWKSMPEPTDNTAIGSSQFARAFGMPYTDARQIFFGRAYTQTRFFGVLTEYMDFDDVTPDMVADAIDSYLARAE